MFKILLLLAPAFLRNSIPSAIKWTKYAAALSILGALTYFVYSTIQDNNKRELEIIQSRTLIALQDKKIQEQLELVKKMNETIHELQLTYEITTVAVAELQQEQQRIEQVVQDKRRVIDAKLKQIDSLNIPQAAKEIKKSQTLIKGLNETYCEHNYIEVPKELLVHCSATAPPNAQAYAELDPQAKEYILVVYASSLLKDIATCNSRIVKNRAMESETIHCISRHVQKERGAKCKDYKRSNNRMKKTARITKSTCRSIRK